jgi:phage shock protein A
MTLVIEILASVIGTFVVLDMFTGFRMIRSLGNRLRLKADKVADEIRDPIADAHAALENIKSKREEMVALRKNLLLEVKKAKSKETRATNEMEKFENLAKLAGEAGNREDVRVALEKKTRSRKNLDAAQLDIARLSKQEDLLEEKIKEFDSLIEKAENDKTYLESSLKINKFNTQVNEVLKDNNGTALTAIEKLRADVENSALEAELSGELAEDQKSLETKYLTPSAEVSEDDIEKYFKK